MSETSILLAEYNAAQESIAHYEKLIWTIGSVSNALVIVTIGTFINTEEPHTVLFGFFVSLILHGLWLLFETRYRQINISKFQRLWEIEEKLSMYHHLKVKKDDETRSVLIRADLLIRTICISFPLILFGFYVLLLCQKV